METDKKIPDLEYEKLFLLDLIRTLKMFKPELGKKLEFTGLLTEKLAKELNLESIPLYFAGYYANIGLLMLEQITNKGFIENESEKNLIKDHVYYSSDFLESRGLEESSKIVKLHHEKPNAMGYFSKINVDKRAAIVNLADEFVGASSNSHYKPHRVKNVAIDITITHYSDSTMWSENELKTIRKVLSDFYPLIRK